jgi:Adenylate and Guanylate cyclase catalytic domain
MERRLAAIMALDVVGYSRLMVKDEAGTLEALRNFRTTILNPIVEQHGGRIFKHTGDGALIEFASAIDAVNGACEIQRELLLKAAPAGADQLRLRIGINLGDVVVEDGDIYGDGVNVAARLEGIAQADTILVSGPVYEISNKMRATAIVGARRPLRHCRAFVVSAAFDARRSRNCSSIRHSLCAERRLQARRRQCDPLSSAAPLLAGATNPREADRIHAALCSRIESENARMGRSPSNCFRIVIKDGPGACHGSADCRKPVDATISFAANYVLAEFLGDNAVLQRAHASHPPRTERRCSAGANLVRISVLALLAQGQIVVEPESNEVCDRDRASIGLHSVQDRLAEPDLRPLKLAKFSPVAQVDEKSRWKGHVDAPSYGRSTCFTGIGM